jgi:uncharacterized protein YndB with AHSA1/START domain
MTAQVRHTRTVAAPLDAVFDLFTTADGLCEWLAVRAEVDARIGGSIRWTHDNGDVVAGTFVAFERPHRIVFTYGWERGGYGVPVESSEVEVTFTRVGDATRLTLIHRGLPDALIDIHARGWSRFLPGVES